MDVKSFIHVLVDYPKLSEGKFSYYLIIIYPQMVKFRDFKYFLVDCPFSTNPWKVFRIIYYMYNAMPYVTTTCVTLAKWPIHCRAWVLS